MRVVAFNQFFWPDLAPTAQYLGDLTRHLAAAGHEVTVICSAESYAADRVSSGASQFGQPQVTVIKVPGLFYNRGVIGRLLSYARFFAGALWHGLRVPRPDILLTMTTPPMLGAIGAVVKTFRGSRHYIWEMDLFPDALVTLGAMQEKSLITGLLASFQNSIRRHSDGVIVLGSCMRHRLLASGTPAHLIHTAENWADGNAISPGPNRMNGPVHVFYSGNLGRAHDVQTITSAIRHFRNDPRFLFTFAGGGNGRSQLEELCANEAIHNTSFVPYVDRDHLSEHLAQADIGLVTVRPECLGTVVPSKVYGLMAAARPILFVGPDKSTPSVMIGRFGCGWQVAPGDDKALIALLESLPGNRQEIVDRGIRARAAFEESYDLPLGVARVSDALGLSSPKTNVVLRAAASANGHAAIR